MSPAQQSFTPIYQTTGTSPLRMLNMVAAAFAVAGAGLSIMLLRAPQQPNSSGQSHVVWAAVLLVMALGAPLVSYLYTRRIAVRILRSGDGKTLRIYEPALVGTSCREVAVADVSVVDIAPGDPVGEKSLSPSRLEVAVRGGHGFIVSLDKKGEQRATLIAALQQP